MSATRRFLEWYQQRADKENFGFLSLFFRTPEQNFFNAEEVEIDIERGDEDVAIAVRDIREGYRDITAAVFTNKKFVPPSYAERLPYNSFDMQQRQPNNTPYDEVNFAANLTERVRRDIVKTEFRFRRAVELQASQVLQTGVLTLVDKSGNPQFELDYKPKATHFVTTAVAWNNAAATPLDDIAAIAETIRNDGKSDPNALIMGENAYNEFISSTQVKEALDNRRIVIGEVQRSDMRSQGATFRGSIDIGNYKFEIWTYNGRFKDPQTGNMTTFIDKGNVVVLDVNARFDAVFGGVPNRIGARDNRLPALPFPDRLRMPERRIDLFVNPWLSPDGVNLNIDVASRPLLIPTAIDTYGTLDTGV